MVCRAFDASESMGQKNKSRKKKRIRPYKAIKFEYVEMSDPFGDMR